MLTAACTECGRPRPLSLATPERITCPCGYDGPPHPDVQGAIRAALAELHGLRQRRAAARSTRRRATLSKVGSVATIIRAVLAIVVGPATLFLVCVFLRPDNPAWLNGAFIGPAVLLLPALPVAAIWTFVALRSEPTGGPPRAVAPERTDEPPRCHVCGAPLAVAHGQATVPCAFCLADNIVDAEALRPQAIAVRTSADHATAVAASAQRLEKTGFSIRLVVALLAFAAFVIGPALGCLTGLFFGGL